MGDGGEHPLSDGCPSEWASSWGQDEHGVFEGFTVGGVEQRMRWIAPGSFLMGSPASDRESDGDERPQHEVTLTRGYWLADTPVTQALWKAVMGESPSHFEGADRPVETVSWEDCQRFCDRLNQRMPTGFLARLPTEAEWEHACRAGTNTPRYASDLGSIAWFSDNSEGQTHPVKQKHPNPWGLYDMLGNVDEWCLDCWDYGTPYSSGEPEQDPTGAATGGRRVIRGGSWSGPARLVRAAYRYGLPPGDRYQSLGLRLARDQPKPG